MKFKANTAILFVTLYLAGMVEFGRICLLAPEAGPSDD